MRTKEAIRKLKLLKVQYKQKGDISTCEALERGIEALQASDKLPAIIKEIQDGVRDERIS